MLRVARLPYSQPGALTLLVSKRWQKTTATSTTGTTATTNPSATSKPSAKPTSNATTTTSPKVTSSIPHYSTKSSPVPPFSAPPNRKSGGAGGTMLKALIYGVTLGVTGTIVYAEYENGPFRKQLESTIPYSSTVLGSIDEFIDPILGRQKTPTTPDKLPDLAYVKEKAPDANKLKPIVETTKSTTNTVVEKPSEKSQIQKATTQIKDAVDHATDKVQNIFL